MAVYDLEEQDKLEDLKAWWTQWGNTIAGIVIAVCVGVIGVQGWRWWWQHQAEQASVLYSGVSAAGGRNSRRPVGSTDMNQPVPQPFPQPIEDGDRFRRAHHR